MEALTIGGQQFTYVNGYKRDETLRAALNALAQQVYGFDFIKWYDNGHWGDNYVPHSLMNGDKMVSNVSVSEITFLHEDKLRTYIQIGTVMTSPDYRHKGLNRVLMEKVLETWQGRCDLIYLFANDTVLDFYPKFSFRPIQEYQYSVLVEGNGNGKRLTKLNMAEKDIQAFVFDMANKSAAVSPLSMQNNASIIMFWLTYFYSDLAYYSKDHQAVIVMKEEGE